MKRARLTEEEKAWRRHQRKAAALNAKARADAGMFADVPGVVEEVTADDMWRRWRYNVAKAAENLGSIGLVGLVRPLQIVQAQSLEDLARELLGPEVAERLRAKARKIYRDYYGYAYSFWCGVMTTPERVVFAMIPNPEPGGRPAVIPVDFWPPDGHVPPMTRDQFHARFPYKDPPLEQEPDDSGLFERVMAAVRSRGAA
jgi:hypothetical protein